MVLSEIFRNKGADGEENSEDTFLYNTNDIESTRGNKPMKLMKRIAGAKN